MSITVNLYYTGENGNALKFAQEMENSGTADAIRREEGNLRYEYFQPLQDKETVLLIDSWESQQALDVHHASPMMQTIAALSEEIRSRKLRTSVSWTKSPTCAPAGRGRKSRAGSPVHTRKNSVKLNAISKVS